MKLTTILLRKKVFSLLVAGAFLFTLPFSFVACSDGDDNGNATTVDNGGSAGSDSGNSGGGTTSGGNDGNGNGQSGENATGGSVSSGKMFMGFDTVVNFANGTAADEITTKILSLTGDTTLKLNGAINAVMLKAIAAAMQENDSVQIALDLSDTTGVVEWKDWFAEIDTLHAISLPKVVTMIQSEAFKNCTELKAVTIPCGIQSLSSGDYYSVTVNLAGTVADYLESPVDFGQPLYFNGTELSGRLSIPDSVTIIKRCAFMGYDKLTSVTIPESVVSIGDFAFNGCSGLTSVTIGSGVTSIGNSVFGGCSSLNEVIITDGDTTLTVGYNNYDSYIWKGLFYDCPLKKVYLGRNLSYSADTSIIRSPFYNKQTLTSLEIGGSLTSISEYEFCECSGLTTVTIGDGVADIGNHAFEGCTGLREVFIEDGDTTLTLGYNASSPYVGSGRKGLFYDCPLEKIYIGRNLSYSADSTSPFYNKEKLVSVEIGDSVTSIDGELFEACNKLMSVTVGGNIISIGKSAFYNTGLTKVYYAGTIDKWLCINYGNYSSNPCYNGAELYISGKKITDVIVPEGVTSIGNYAFYGCTWLTSVILPTSVSSIGEDVFLGCTRLKKVYYNGVLAQWLTIDFDGYYSNPCCNIAELYINGEKVIDAIIPDGVKTIGVAAFRGCSGLASVTIPESVTSIGKYAFSNCSSLTNIIIPDSVTSIGDSAFIGSKNLTSVILSKKVTNIGDSMFQGCSRLASMVIPDGVTSIGNYAFNSCSELTSVTIGDSLTSIGAYGFYGCSNLATINYRGTSAQWESINFTYGNTPLTSATIVYNYTGE